ncbi:MAG: winged helix-turn-helix transcriptional regulator [Candidatus Angelobacter sp.]
MVKQKNHKGDSGVNVIAALPPGEVSWVMPPKELGKDNIHWGPTFYEISDNLHKLGLTTGAHLMLEKMCRFLFHLSKHALPSFREIARVMGLSVSAAWRHLNYLIQQGLVEVVERKPGTAHKLSLAPLYKALRRVLGIDAALEQEACQDDINRLLSRFAAETNRTIHNVSNYRNRLDAAAQVAGWPEHQLYLAIRDMMPVAKIAASRHDPIGYLIRAIEQKAANIGKERFVYQEKAPDEQEPSAPDCAAAAQQESETEAATPADERERENARNKNADQPANSCNSDDPEPSEPAGQDDRRAVDSLADGLGEEAGIPDDAPVFLRLAFEEWKRTEQWPMVLVEHNGERLYTVPTADSWFNLCEDRSEAWHIAAEQALRKRWLRKGFKLPEWALPVAAAGGD